LALAEKAADDARARLGETLNEIQEQLSPANLLRETSRGLREKGLQYTDQLIASVSSRPIVAAAAASGIGWLLSNKPGLAMLVKLFLGRNATSRASAHSTVSRPRRSPRRRASARPAETSEETE
jgi:hypothetical protein